MHLLFTAAFSNEFFQALCWTLMHSIWHGLIAAIITAVIVTLTKRSSASVRYNLLIAVLILFIFSTGITAYRQFQFGGVTTDLMTIHPNDVRDAAVSFDKNEGPVSDEARDHNLTGRLILFFNEHASTIVLVWFLFFLIKCTQLVVGLQYIHRIRHRRNYEVSLYWKKRLLELAEKTGIRHSILFLESELVKVPAVIGFLKPVLLVPVGLLSNLPPEQVEAILLHELAHIGRRDFLVNLLQTIMETLFFFNPAIVWISSLIREEREACCDDMVIANLPQKRNYLQALVSFQELHLNTETHAMALTGQKNYLFNRIKRILTQENKKLNLMEKTALLLGIIGITAFSFITKETKENPPAVTAKEIIKPMVNEIPATAKTSFPKKPVVKVKKPKTLSLPKNIPDTVPKTSAKPTTDSERKFPSISSSTNNDGNTIVSSIVATDNTGKHYRIKRVDGKITELVVNGTTIPPGQYGEYDELIRQIDQTQKQNIIKRKEKMELKKAEAASKRKEHFEKRATMAKAANKERVKRMDLKRDSVRAKNFRIAQANKLAEQKNEAKKREHNIKKAEVAEKQKHFREGRRTNDDVSRIISDLNSHQLVTDPENFSFSLNNNELIVNGKKQPAEIYQQFKERYIQNSGDRFNYSKKGSTTNITINRD